MTRAVFTALAAALLLPIAGAAFATDTPSTDLVTSAAPAHPVKKVKTQSPDDVVCKDVAETGSRLSSHRTCMTRGEWALESQRAHDAMMGGRSDGVTPGK